MDTKMSTPALPSGITKTPAGIDGFDHISLGGLPTGASTLLSGTSGSGKTVFGMQFLIGGIRELGEHGVFVTFEEPPHKIIRHMAGFGWDLASEISEGRLRIIDATPEPGEQILLAGSFDFAALMARIEHAIRQVDAKRVVMDSLAAVFPQFGDAALVRRELHRIVHGLSLLGVTTIITMERGEEYGEIARFGVEEFVADNVMILRNPLDRERRRRTIEILKFRGTNHQKGEYPLTIDPRNGITVIPLSAIELKQPSSTVRISSGNADIDTMCGGGIFRDSIILVSAYRDHRSAGRGADEAIIEAVRQRLRPVLLTSLTTGFGLVPMMLETSLMGAAFIPLAVVICFGMLYGTLLILLVIPAILSALETCALWLRDLRADADALKTQTPGVQVS